VVVWNSTQICLALQVLDEGHKIKNEETLVSNAVRHVHRQVRIFMQERCVSPSSHINLQSEGAEVSTSFIQIGVNSFMRF
jgi:predicted ribonuclease YlaK